MGENKTLSPISPNLNIMFKSLSIYLVYTYILYLPSLLITKLSKFEILNIQLITEARKF